MTDWYELAACKGMDPNLFHPERGSNGAILAAKAVCRGCDVRSECLETAMDNHETIGVWGGLSERQRRRLRGGPTNRRHVQLVCVECGGPFTAGSGAAKVCGDCKRLRNIRPPKRCAVCHTVITGRSKHAKYCAECSHHRRCGDCNQFTGPDGHDCPVRQAAAS